MSKIGQAVMEIQDLAYQGVPNVQIAQYVKAPISFVDDVVRDFFEEQFGPAYEMEVDDGA